MSIFTALFQLAAAQEWLEHLSASELVALAGCVVISVALVYREARENRRAKNFGRD